jgi:hypothetical protein
MVSNLGAQVLLASAMNVLRHLVWVTVRVQDVLDALVLAMYGVQTWGTYLTMLAHAPLVMT